MRYFVLACDYDGTIAHDGRVDEATRQAFQRLRASGRKLLLVTGRELEDLRTVLPDLDELFDGVVAENGGLLYWPKTRAIKLLCDPPDVQLLAMLRARGVAPISVGHTIIATWQPHEDTVLAAIRELGLELQVIFNKGAVMILPSGLNKASGLRAALAELGISPHNCVGVGDAENDHAFLETCEASVAVANALPSLKERADLITAGDHGGGVIELIDRLVSDDLASLDNTLVRHHLRLGALEEGTPVEIRSNRANVLICGRSGSGKSTLAATFVERLQEDAFQFCIVAPEGDYPGSEQAIRFGTGKQPPNIEEVVHLLQTSDKSAIVNLSDVPALDRPAEFTKLLTHLQHLRANSGRPHWLVVDEAHHVLPAAHDTVALALTQQPEGLLLVTVEPPAVRRVVLDTISVVIAVGAEGPEAIRSFCQAVDRAAPQLPATISPNEAVLWQVDQAVVVFRPDEPHQQRRRHHHKYAEGDLGDDRSFYFRGVGGRLNLRAQNLSLFVQIATGVDDETWTFHRQRGDYSQWIRGAVKDESLADSIADVETKGDLGPGDSRREIAELIQAAYSLPATPQ